MASRPTPRHDPARPASPARRVHQHLQQPATTPIPGQAHPAEVYTARAKATPNGRDGHWRIRHDKVTSGRVTLRHAGRLHHIGLGYEHNGRVVRILVHDLHITVIHADTGEIIRDLALDPDRDYQPLGRKPGPVKGLPQRGGRKRKTPPA